MQNYQKYLEEMVAERTRDLKEKSEQVLDLSNKLARYLSPQLSQSILEGSSDARIESKRKKLTVFFSDIVGFTESTEKMEPEEITCLLNQYYSEMSAIALKHGGTIDKLVGDAMMVFFGDPVSKGLQQDALDCVSMALEMKKTLQKLQKDWYLMGITRPFAIRIGINTGYCTVGNFGSQEKMDYTVIGTQVNAAARLEQSAAEGDILISHETWSLIKDSFSCVKMMPIEVKGISNPIQTYRILGPKEEIERGAFSVSIGDLVEKPPVVTRETLIQDIPLGRRQNDHFEAVVVVEDDEPVGLIMNYSLNRLLTLNADRKAFFLLRAEDVMFTSPLIEDKNESVQEVVNRVLERNPDRIYDHVVVTADNRLEGIVRVHRLLEKLNIVGESTW